MNTKSTSTKKVVVNSLVYSISGLLLKCFSFFLLPLYTVYLTTEDYGVTSIVNSFISTMSFIVACSLYSAIMRFYVDYKEKKETLKRFYGTITLFVFLSSLAWMILLIIFRGVVSKYVFSGMNFYPIILICLVSLTFSCQHTIYENILRSQQRAAKCSFLSIAYFLVTVALNILFVVVFKMGAVGVLLSTLIAGVAYSVVFVVDMMLHKQITFCIDVKLLFSALKYSLPIMPHNLSTNIAVLMSKVLIGDVVSLSSLGIYTVASQFGNVADTIQSYVDNAYGPWLYEKLNAKEQNYKKAINGITKALSAVIGLFFVGISLFAQDYIFLFVDKNYIDAWKYVPLMVGVFAIKTIYYFYVEVLFYYKQASKFLFTATLSSSLINVMLSCILIPIWGVYGSIAADGIAMLIRVSIVVLISRKFEDIGLHVRDFVLNFGGIMGFIFIGLAPALFLDIEKFSIAFFAYKILVVIAYILCIAIRNKDYLKPIMKIVYKKIKRS